MHNFQVHMSIMGTANVDWNNAVQEVYLVMFREHLDVDIVIYGKTNTV
jgi:hypothetical protein